MIEAFKSTLEELIYTNAVILVIDISDPISELQKKFKSCLRVLEEIGVDYKKIIFALNKSDLISQTEITSKVEILGLKENKKWLSISAITGEHLLQLKDLLDNILKNEPVREKKIKKKEIQMNYED